MKKIKITEELDIEEVIADLNRILSYTERVNEYRVIKNGINVINGLVNELKQSKEEMQLQENRMKALGFSDKWEETADLQIAENEAVEKQVQEEQEIKVDSDFFTDEAKKKLKLSYNCFGDGYMETSPACVYCCLKNECKRVTEENTHLGWDE